MPRGQVTTQNIVTAWLFTGAPGKLTAEQGSEFLVYGTGHTATPSPPFLHGGGGPSREGAFLS